MEKRAAKHVIRLVNQMHNTYPFKMLWLGLARLKLDMDLFT